MVLPIAFKDRNIVCFSAPRLKVDAALEAILLEGLQDHTFGVDLCTQNKSSGEFDYNNSLNSPLMLKSGFNTTADQFMEK